VSTVRIIGATIENTEASTSLYHDAFVADIAGHFITGGDIFGFLYVFAFGVIATGHEDTTRASPFDELATTLRTILAGFFGAFIGAHLALEGASASTVREATATVEFSHAAELDDHGTPTFGAEHIGWSITEGGHLFNFFFGLHGLGEGGIEMFEGGSIVSFALGDFIELGFHLSGEGVTDNIREVFFEEGTHDIAGVSDTQ
jgi:hypothetical protein